MSQFCLPKLHVTIACIQWTPLLSMQISGIFYVVGKLCSFRAKFRSGNYLIYSVLDQMF